MKPKLVRSLVENSDKSYHGRVRTYQFLEEYLEGCCANLPMKLTPTPTYYIPPSLGWEFINENKLQFAIDSDDDEGIQSRFLRAPFSPEVREDLSRFLSARLPSPLILEGVFAGEDMGYTPPLGLFPRVYLMDTGESVQERVHSLEGAIKSIWAKIFSRKSKKFMQNLELPMDHWMLSVMVTEPSAPRRGSFYYPDITCVVMGGYGMEPKGFVTGGWWEPSHPEFPSPVAFTPGEAIHGLPEALLAMEARGGVRSLTRISTHLAKTHGTMNLEVVSGESRSKKKVSQPSVFEGDGSPFTMLTKALLRQASELLQEPVTLHLTLQPNNYTGEYEVFLNSVRTIVPKKLDTIMPKPVKHNVDYIFNSIPATGYGSGFARYFIEVSGELNPEMKSALHSYLNILTCEGESAVITATTTCNLTDAMALGEHYSVLGICAPKGVERLPHRLFQINVPFTMKNLNTMVKMNLAKGLTVLVSPKPVKIVVDDGLATAWL